MSKTNLLAPRKLSALLRYGLVVCCVAAAVVVTHLLRRFMDATPLFFVAVIISAWCGGLGLGLLAVMLATITVDYFFVPPLYTFAVGISGLPYILAFSLASLITSWLVATRKQAQDSLRAARDELEQKVHERTANLEQSNERLQAEISERRHAEDALRENQHLLRAIIDNAAALVIKDIEGRYMLVNRHFAELFQRDAESVIGKTSHDLFPTEQARLSTSSQLKATGAASWNTRRVATRTPTQITDVFGVTC